MTELLFWGETFLLDLNVLGVFLNIFKFAIHIQCYYIIFGFLYILCDGPHRCQQCCGSGRRSAGRSLTLNAFFQARPAVTHVCPTAIIRHNLSLHMCLLKFVSVSVSLGVGKLRWILCC